jgi:hypothetical protein
MAAYTFSALGFTLPALCEQRGGAVGERMVKSGDYERWYNATVMTSRERASQRRAFYGIHPWDEPVRSRVWRRCAGCMHWITGITPVANSVFYD